jgi:hypothetical protein
MKQKYISPIIKYLFYALFFVAFTSKGQITNPAPYCYPTADSMTSGTCTGSGGSAGYGFCIKSINIYHANYSQSSNCYGSSNKDVYRYWNTSISFNGGKTYNLTVTSPQCSKGYQLSAGVWIDFDQDNKFSAAELVDTRVSNNIYTTSFPLSFNVPCSAKSGKTRMRVRIQKGGKIIGADSCNIYSGFGETWDFDVSIVKPTSINANFNIPAQAYFKNPVSCTYPPAMGNDYYELAWDKDNDGTYESKGNSYPYYVSKWDSVGTKCIKLRSTNCFGTDSVVKCLKIVQPSGKPIIDFFSCYRLIEIYDAATITGIYDNGPYEFTWEVYDSSSSPIADFRNGVWLSNSSTIHSRDIQISFADYSRLYTVKLTAKNDLGTTTLIKKKYLKSWDLNAYSYISGSGFNGRIQNDYGDIFDAGGEKLNYRNNANKGSYLVVNPDATNPINIEFRQIRLKDVYDSIIIYDDDKINPSKVLAVLNSKDNGTYPKFKTSSNRFCFYFRSDSFGTDSGFHAVFFNGDHHYGPGKQNPKIGHNIIHVNGNSVFYNEGENIETIDYDRIWTVNDTFQTAAYNLDTFRYKFKYSGTQKVCLELKNCDSSIKRCENIAFSSGEQGTAFIDNNSNCKKDAGDGVVPNVKINLYDSVQKTTSWFYTSANGDYNFNKLSGAYKLSVDTAKMPFKVNCNNPGVDSVVRINSSNPLSIIYFNLACKPGFDLGVQNIWVSRDVRPGKEFNMKVNVGEVSQLYNLSCASNVSGTVEIFLPNFKGQYIKEMSGAIKPTMVYRVDSLYDTLTNRSIDTTHIVYNISDFSKVNNANNFGVVLKLDSILFRSPYFPIKVKLTSSGTDRNQDNNVMEYIYWVRNSYDPNMKEVSPPEIEEGFDGWLSYTIHFQNIGTAPAIDVRVADTLDKRFDLETFQLLNNSHPMTTLMDNGKLSFMFKDINLPDSNTDEKASHGYIQYRIKPKTPLLKNEVLKNTAYIYFDYNPAVVTNTATSVALPKGILIPDSNFAAWLTNMYPSCMRNGNLMDTSCDFIKKSTSVDVKNNAIKDLFGIQFFNSLQNLDCSGNQLINLPALQKSLKVLNCLYNKFKTLPVLPQSLTSLNCDSNGLSTLPTLPSSLTYLSCQHNKIEALPLLPATLSNLLCGWNHLDALPKLPTSLNQLFCNNNKIVCFDVFAESISEINITNNKNNCLPNYISAMDVANKSMALCKPNNLANNPDGCVSTLTSQIAGTPVLEIKIYPNPGHDLFRVELPTETGWIKLEVYNMLGDIVYVTTSIEKMNTIDLSGVAPGIYSLKLSAEEIVINKCLIKQ